MEATNSTCTCLNVFFFLATQFLPKNNETPYKYCDIEDWKHSKYVVNEAGNTKKDYVYQNIAITAFL